MLANITIGQYFPGDSILHKLDPRGKIILTVCFMTGVFLVKYITGYLFIGLFVGICIAVSGINAKLIINSLKPVWFLIVFTFVLNIFFSTSGKVIWEWKFLRLTESGLSTAFFLSIRFIFLIIGTSLLTFTTSPISLTDGLEMLLSPLKKVGFPSHELAMMMTIALRFIPTIIEETDKIMAAQKARGADFESGNLLRRAKALIPLLVPLFVGAFRRADELAVAMECRCYRGGDGRTRMRQLHLTLSDGLAGVLCLLVFGGAIALGRLGW